MWVVTRRAADRGLVNCSLIQRTAALTSERLRRSELSIIASLSLAQAAASMIASTVSVIRLASRWRARLATSAAFSTNAASSLTVLEGEGALLLADQVELLQQERRGAS